MKIFQTFYNFLFWRPEYQPSWFPEVVVTKVKPFFQLIHTFVSFVYHWLILCDFLGRYWFIRWLIGCWILFFVADVISRWTARAKLIVWSPEIGKKESRKLLVNILDNKTLASKSGNVFIPLIDDDTLLVCTCNLMYFPSLGFLTTSTWTFQALRTPSQKRLKAIILLKKIHKTNRATKNGENFMFSTLSQSIKSQT